MIRRRFLSTATAGAGSYLLCGSRLQDKRPPVDMERVKEFVSVAHRDVAEVTRLLNDQPALLHCAWDWGGGDFETAIGAGSHVGHREMVEFLLSRGARMNIFSAAMLGKVDLVRAIANAFPSQLKAKGPHDLSLMHHARKGGRAAEPVVEFLLSQGIEE